MVIFIIILCFQKIHHRWEHSGFIWNSRFLTCQIFFSGYCHRHISVSLNVIKIIFWIFLVRLFSSMYTHQDWWLVFCSTMCYLHFLFLLTNPTIKSSKKSMDVGVNLWWGYQVAWGGGIQNALENDVDGADECNSMCIQIHTYEIPSDI